MTQEEKLKERFGREGGWKVPDGYFEDFYMRMSENLPAYPEAPKQPDLSVWQRLKPYVYLAAMFAGIWMTMKLFYTVSDPGRLSLENPPENIAMVMEDFSSSESLPLPNMIEDIGLEEELMSEYADISEFEKDFGYELKPQYEGIDVKKYVAET